MDKAQEKELAKVEEAVEEVVVAEVVEKAVEEEVEAEEVEIQEEPTILETPQKNEESYPHLLMEEAQKRLLTSLSK